MLSIISIQEVWTPESRKWAWSVIIMFVSCNYAITRGWHYIVACTLTRDPGQDLGPSNFCAWPLDRTENSALTLDYSALATPI